MDYPPTAVWMGRPTSEVSPKPSAEQGVLCCKRSFMQQKTYLAMFPENIKIRLLKRTCSDRSIMTGQMDYSLYRYMRLD